MGAAPGPAAGAAGRSRGDHHRAPRKRARRQARADDRRRRAGRVGDARCAIATARSSRSSRARAVATSRSASASSACWRRACCSRWHRRSGSEAMARQQMEFVAAVSHELRTPLAVICSAGENLADGVVADGEQVKRYGSLIETEGRRLGDMVERVMEFAGISAGTAMRARADVDVAKRRHRSRRGGESTTRGIAASRSTSIAMARCRRSSATSTRCAPRCRTSSRNAVKYSPAARLVDVSTAALERHRRRACRFGGRSRTRHRRRRPAAHLQAVLSRAPRRRCTGSRHRRRLERGAARRRRARRHNRDRQPRRRRHDGRLGTPGGTAARRDAVSSARLDRRRLPRVLLVEDEAGLRLTLTDRLGSEGYSVETASDGESGLARRRAAATISSCST